MRSAQKEKYETQKKLGPQGPFEVEVACPRMPGAGEKKILLKRLRPGWAVDPLALQAFVEDVQRLLAIVHPNVLQVLDVGEDEDGFFLATEVIHGLSLSMLTKRTVESGKPLPLELAFLVLLQACNGLQAGCDAKGPNGDVQGVVHGALSPTTVLITFDGVVKLKDFGVYRLYQSKELSSVRRQPVWNLLSPEQRSGQPPTSHSDLFTLGQLFRSLAGWNRIAPGPEDPAWKIELRQKVSRCVEADPRRRWMSAGELARELEDLKGLDRGESETQQLAAFIGGLFRSKVALPPREEGPSERKTDNFLDPASFWSSDTTVETKPSTDTKGQPSPLRAGLAAWQSGTAPSDVSGARIGVDERETIAQAPRETPAKPQEFSSGPAVISNGGLFNPVVPAKTPFRPEEGPSVSRWQRVWSAAAVVGVALLSGALGWWLFSGSGEPMIELAPGDRQGLDAAPDEQRSPDQDRAPDGVVSADSNGRPTGPAKDLGNLRLSSNPPGATVLVEGEKRGVTPTTVSGLVPGAAVLVEVRLEGYQPWSRLVELNKEQPEREIGVDLIKQSACEKGVGWIYLISTPSGATVEIDDRRLPDKTPLVVDSVCADKAHKLLVLVSGFRPWGKEVEVQANEVLNLKVELVH